MRPLCLNVLIEVYFKISYNLLHKDNSSPFIILYIYTKEYVKKQVEKEDFVRFVIDSLARKFSFSEFLLIIESVF